MFELRIKMVRGGLGEIWGRQNGKHQGSGDTAGSRCLRIAPGSVGGGGNDVSVETDLCIRICLSFHFTCEDPGQGPASHPTTG